MGHRFGGIGMLKFLAGLSALLLMAQPAAASTVHGPYNAQFPAGGDGLAKPLSAQGGNLAAGGAWSVYGWIAPSEIASGRVVIAGAGDAGSGRFLALDDGRLSLLSGGEALSSTALLSSGAWRFVAAVCDGTTARLYVDGAQIAEETLAQPGAASTVLLAPRGIAQATPFAGRIAGFTAEDRALPSSEIAALAARRPDFDLVVFETGSPTWPVQVRQMYGQVTPQDPWTLPKSKEAFSQPVAKPAYDGPALQADGTDAWRIAKWRLAEAPKVSDGGAHISRPGYDAKSWYAATVPGTVLTTLIDRGVYPDPDYGLNNMAIPESLNKQDYWYRTEFDAPKLGRRHLMLTFNGINYAAEVWLNGARLGTIRGAFIRGQFDVTGKLKPGKNAIAVKVSPPPHPGIAEEESLTAGVGENGGMEALDGPTFIASEGWDWIPSVRDRNTGLWQDVVLEATGAVRLGDAQIVTTLPKADNGVADVEISVPIVNPGVKPVVVEIHARFDDVSVVKKVTAAPGQSIAVLAPKEFRQLSVAHPRLWWPNGYGEPTLHMLHLSLWTGKTQSDHRDIRFGMRQITYELSLMDSAGHLRRVEIDPSKARQLGETITDGRHQAVHKIPNGWAASLTPGAENSAAVHELSDTQLAPYLVIKVNGVRIAARGGSWGTDDWRKRVSRERLEPFFRLHRDANMNIIRNWVGQNTEDVFYDLADEYGLLILNDFWASTQDYQLEPQDVPLFLGNAADVIARYRNHPSIAVWFGRNEGIPQPVLNEGMEKLIHDLDGTRYYSGSSNRVNLQDSGPYNYREPETYFTQNAKGFSVEVGTPSFPTLEAFEAAVPQADRWPISDVWAYHDWHITGNGATKSFTDAMAAKFGAPTSLEDFERKAQMMNYESYRAIFEGMNAQLWTKNSGRLLWMTQPAWPSTAWQILSHDTDTHGAYYGVKKAAEPVHVQMNLPDHRLAVVNNKLAPITGAVLHARVYGLDGRLLSETTDKIDAPANAVTNASILELGPMLQANGVVLVKLDLMASDNAALAGNFYWVAKDDKSSTLLSGMQPQTVTISASAANAGGETHIEVTLRDEGSAPALNVKMTLLDAQGARVLPAYYGDNYISLLPGETREVEISCSASCKPAQIALRGWNVRQTETGITPP
jgi:hypothetical protein